MKIGEGTVHNNGTMTVYEGGIPFEDGDQVYIIKKREFEQIVKDGIRLLDNTGTQMDKNLVSYFPDGLSIQTTKGDQMLYISPKMLSHDFSRYLYIKYVSIDELIKGHNIQSVVEDKIEDPIVMRDKVNGNH